MHKITAVGKYFSICFRCIHQPYPHMYPTHTTVLCGKPERIPVRVYMTPIKTWRTAHRGRHRGPTHVTIWSLCGKPKGKGAMGRWVGGPTGRMGDGWHGHVCRISLRIAAGYVGQHFSANPPFTNNNNNSSGKKGPARNEGPWSWVESRPKWHSG